MEIALARVHSHTRRPPQQAEIHLHHRGKAQILKERIPGHQLQLQGVGDRGELSEDGTFVLRPGGRDIGSWPREGRGFEGRGGLGVKAPK